MNNPTYEQRVQAVAEEMAKDAGLWDHIINAELRDEFITAYLKPARIAVEQRAAGIRAYAIYSTAVPANKSYTVEQYLKYQGLIPDTEQEQFNPDKEAKTISVVSQMFGKPDKEAGTNGH